MELDPGFTKNWLYSLYAWKNGWRVEWKSATNYYNIIKRNDKGWVGYYKVSTRIWKQFNDNEDYEGRICGYNPFYEYYSIKYNNDDEEEFTQEEVEKYKIETTTDDNGNRGPTGMLNIYWITHSQKQSITAYLIF